MLPEVHKKYKTRTIRYLDGSVGPELQPRDVILVFLIAISYEYSNSNPPVFNQLNKVLLKILFLTDSGYEITACHVWSRFITGLNGDLGDVIAQVREQLIKLTHGQVSDLMEFFTEVDTLISSRSASIPLAVPIAQESIFGLFLRRSALQFKNLKFHQLVDLYNKFKTQIDTVFTPHDDVIQPDFSHPPPSPPSFMDSGDFYAGVREIYSNGVVERKVNLLELSPQDDPLTLHTTADICQTSLMMSHLYHRYGYNKQALRFLKEAIRLAHELGLKEVSRVSADWLKVYLKLSNQPPVDIQDGNYYLDSLLTSRVHKCAAEWKDGQASKVVAWTSELAKATTMKCLYWEKFGKVEMTALSSQLALSTLEGEGGNWVSLPGHDKARACNAVIFLAKMLCSRGEYQPAMTLLDKLRTDCPLNTWLYAQTSETLLDIETEKCLLAGELKEVDRLIILLAPFSHTVAKLKEAELLLLMDNAEVAYAELTQLSDTKRMKTQVHMRYLLDVAQCALQSTCPGNANSPLSQCLSLSDAAKATHYSSAVHVQQAHCFLLLNKSQFAVRLLRAKLLEIVECGGVLVRAAAHFTLAQALLMETKKISEENSEEILDLLQLSLSDFTDCGAVNKQLDVLALLTNIYTKLGDKFSEEKERLTDQLWHLYHEIQELKK